MGTWAGHWPCIWLLEATRSMALTISLGGKTLLKWAHGALFQYQICAGDSNLRETCLVFASSSSTVTYGGIKIRCPSCENLSRTRFSAWANSHRPPIA